MAARRMLPRCCCLVWLIGATALHAADAKLGAEFSHDGDEIVFTDHDRPIARLVLRDKVVRRPYLADVKTPGGIQVTRRHPPVVGEDAVDHDTMHPGVWFALGDLNGEDFWRNKGEMRPADKRQAMDVVESATVSFSDHGTLQRADGRTLGKQLIRIDLHRIPEGYLYAWEFVLQGDTEPLDFGVQEEMGFGARMATPLTEKAGGIATSADGRTGAKKIWGTRDRWCDYSGTLEGKQVGITLMPHPSNPRPTWWHTRDYGVFVANGFGPRSVDEGAEPRLKVPAGETIMFRYAALVHESDAAKKPDLERVYQHYVSSVAPDDKRRGASAK
ncbi:MAG: hypothetical protein C0483_08695 [Pirellula sp.]|nr:hypothetical protein [Pirellula sp.]